MFTITTIIATLVNGRWRNHFSRHFPAKFNAPNYSIFYSPTPITNSTLNGATRQLNLSPKYQQRKTKYKMPTQKESTSNVLKFVKMTEYAYTPTRGSKHAAGYDLYSAYNYEIEPMANVLVKTDLQIEVPDGCYGRVAPRSGLALKHFIDVGAGVVDKDYRGNLGVVLFNFSKKPFIITKGDRVAQLICEKVAYADLEEVENLDTTNRGDGGFGSTGIQSS